MKFIYKILLWSILAYSSFHLRGQAHLTIQGACLRIDAGTHLETAGGISLDSGNVLLHGNLTVMDHVTNSGKGSLFHQDSEGLLVAKATSNPFRLSGQPMVVPQLSVMGLHGLILENDLVIQKRLSLSQSVLDLNQHTLTFLTPEWNNNPFPVEEGFFWNGTLRYKAFKGHLRIPSGDGKQQQLMELQIAEHPAQAMIDASWKDTALLLPPALELERRVVLGNALPGYWSLKSESPDGWKLTAKTTYNGQALAQAPASDFQLIHLQENHWETLGTPKPDQNTWSSATALVVNHEDIRALGEWVLVQTKEKATTAANNAAGTPGIQSFRWVNNELEVLFLNEVEQLQLHLTDLRGSVLAHQKYTATSMARMSLPQLPDGVYLLSCSSPGKKPMTYKIFHSQ